MYRYLNNDFFNSAHSSVDIGDHFTYGSKCSGTIKFSESSSPSIPGQQVGINVINTVTTAGATENAKCVVTGDYAGIFNSGINTYTNSSTLDAFNNSKTGFIAAGVSYTVSETNSLQVLATITGTNYTDRQLLSTQNGLFDNLTTDQITATYTKNFGPTISLNAQLGLLGFSDSSWDFGLPHTILPQYAFTAQWNATPKLALNAAASRLASAPTSIVGNLQISDSASAGATYAFSPKLAFSGNLSVSYSNAATSLLVSNPLLNPFTRSQHTYGASARMNYSITPFLAASLSYQFSKSIQSNLTTNDSLILLALNFNPY